MQPEPQQCGIKSVLRLAVEINIPMPLREAFADAGKPKWNYSFAPQI
ncbi:MAG: hypothetical protein HQ518_10980 [Rhodopirellula sp.]|nr:hypothetical protein [Rhodopirellula sp.]